MKVELRVRVEEGLPPIVPDAVSFETGASLAQASDPDLFVYEHHGSEFGPAFPGALTSYFEDLLLGRPFPLTFATPCLADVDTITAIALHLNRDLAVHPMTPAFVSTVDLVHRRGAPALAHIEPDLARFLCFVRTFLEAGLTQREIGDRLGTAIGWIREYLEEGRLPHLAPTLSSTRVVDTGTNGFVVAETTGPLVDSWVDLFRQGFLRGVLFSAAENDRRKVLAARKSHYLAFDLSLAVHLLNQMETAMGELPEWETDGFWLRGPADGTLLLVSHVIEVLLRV